MKKIKLKEILKQQKDLFELEDNKEYKQVTVSNTGEIKLRAIKKGAGIGTKKQYKIKSGQFIYSRLGIHQGSFGIVPEELNEGIVTGDMPVFEIDKKQVFPEILIYLLKQSKIKSIFEDLTRGLAQSRIREKYLLDIEIDLPNLKFQKQILKKINSIKNEINGLEQNVSQDENLLSKLRQAILSEAVQGKLVPQNPDDESASELLKKIKKEKEKLIKEGKIKKGKELPAISDDEIPYELPKGWEWCRLGDVCEYGSSEKIESKNINYETWILDLEDIEKTTSKLLIKKRFKDKPSKSSKNIFLKGDVLYGKLRPYLDKVIIADEAGVCTTEIIPLRIYKNLIVNSYLRYFLKNPNFLAYVDSLTYGVKMPRLGTNDGKLAPFPLPSLSEQRRIVEKVDALMKFCDELELRIKENKVNSEILMNAVLRESFED